MNIFRKTIFTILLSIFLVPNLYGQSVHSDRESLHKSASGQNYALLIRNINQLNAAIKTVDMLSDNRDKSVGHFEVVICGKEVTNLTSNGVIISRARQAGITITVCGMSIKKFSVNKDDLPDEVTVVPNGLIRIFQLQEQGYRTITL